MVHGPPKLRATLVPDLLHWHVSDVDNAINAAGLRVLRLEFKEVTKLRRSPFGKSAHHGVLRMAADNMYTYTTPDTNL